LRRCMYVSEAHRQKGSRRPQDAGGMVRLSAYVLLGSNDGWSGKRRWRRRCQNSVSTKKRRENSDKAKQGIEQVRVPHASLRKIPPRRFRGGGGRLAINKLLGPGPINVNARTQRKCRATSAHRFLQGSGEKQNAFRPDPKTWVKLEEQAKCSRRPRCASTGTPVANPPRQEKPRAHFPNTVNGRL